MRILGHTATAFGLALLAGMYVTPAAQSHQRAYTKPTNLPNPYRLVPDWPVLPATMSGPHGHRWGEVIRVSVGPDGNIWVFQRCFNDTPHGDASCVNRGDANPPILEFNADGRLLKSLGVGLFAHPHGFTVDRQGNIWATDTNNDETVRGVAAKNAQGVTMGQEVLKISPNGKVLMTLGTEGVRGNGPYSFDRPTGVAIAPNGDIFVSDGHSPNKSNTARVVKYSRDGKYIQEWGHVGSEPGNFKEPHDIFVGGSKGRVYVADRLNNRIQVFQQDGRFVASWEQFGQPSSVYIDKHDLIFVGTTFPPALGSSPNANDRAIVIGNALTGELQYLIPDPGDLTKMTDTGTSGSGIAEEDRGNVYVADVGENNLRKYVKVR